MKYILSTCFILLTALLSGQTPNRPVPSFHSTYEFQKLDTTNDSLFYLITPTSTSSSSNLKRYASILDNDGYIRWHTTGSGISVINFQYHETHNLFSYAQFGDNINETKFIIMDSTFQIIDSIQPINNSTTDIHDFIIMENGNYVLTAFRDSIMDLSADTFNGAQGDPNTVVKAAVIQEFDSNHNLIFEWNSLNHIHPREYIDGYPYNVNSFDYIHINAVEEDFDGNFLISCRHTDAIYKLNKTTGNVIWSLGGKSNDFTFISDNNKFSGQHDIRRLSNGNITLFDNANNQPTPRRSRGKEYTLDTTNMTCTKVYQYTYSPPFFARAMGNFQTMPNNERLINYGSVNRPRPSFVHVDENDNSMVEMYLEDSVVTYRTRMAKLPFTLPYPAVSCNGGNGTATLTAPNGFNAYEWSTGETSQTITVSDTGTYQVWVNYGIGMIGSDPITITDINNPCNSVDVQEFAGIKQFSIVKLFDLLGRRIYSPIQGKIYIAQYQHGSNRLIKWNSSFRINE